MNSAPITHEWLTRAQAAEKLQVTSRTIDTYIKDGRLKAAKFGKPGGRGNVRISAASLNALLEPEPLAPRQ